MQSLNADVGYILENKLREALRPVAPNPEFVNHLEYKLTKSSAVLLEDQKNKKVILLIGFGLFFGALLVWLLGKSKS